VNEKSEMQYKTFISDREERDDDSKKEASLIYPSSLLLKEMKANFVMTPKTVFYYNRETA
jgi:hypothetical protein